eukprot:COSAG02_NODE_365_length_23749_cov_13.908584_12_plen_61_part_00
MVLNTKIEEMRLAVAGSPQRHLIANWNTRPQQFRSNYKSSHDMIYDTGANIMCSMRSLTK